MGWESFDVVRFDLGPLLQGKMRIAKLKSAYYLVIIGPSSVITIQVHLCSHVGSDRHIILNGKLPVYVFL